MSASNNVRWKPAVPALRPAFTMAGVGRNRAVRWAPCRQAPSHFGPGLGHPMHLGTASVKLAPPRPARRGPSALRNSNNSMQLRCTQCHLLIHSYDEASLPLPSPTCHRSFCQETLCLAIACLSTFIRRQPGLAAPLLPRALGVVAGLSLAPRQPEERRWADVDADPKPGAYIPANARSAARQHIRWGTSDRGGWGRRPAFGELCFTSWPLRESCCSSSVGA